MFPRIATQAPRSAPSSTFGWRSPTSLPVPPNVTPCQQHHNKRTESLKDREKPSENLPFPSLQIHKVVKEGINKSTYMHQWNTISYNSSLPNNHTSCMIQQYPLPNSCSCPESPNFRCIKIQVSLKEWPENFHLLHDPQTKTP